MLIHVADAAVAKVWSNHLWNCNVGGVKMDILSIFCVYANIFIVIMCAL